MTTTQSGVQTSGAPGTAASQRAAAIAAIPSYQLINTFLNNSLYARRKFEPTACDFGFGNPHQMPQDEYVAALREVLTPQNNEWFAYKTNLPEAQDAAAASLQLLLDVPFEPEHIYLSTGGFAAIALALKAVTDPGDEVIYSLPPWFCYEPMLLAADAVPRKLPLKGTLFDLDLDAIDAAIGPRTRLVIVNSPHNPTGRIYSKETLEALDLCLSCKACATECPVNVDMATYKAEFLHHHYRHGLSSFLGRNRRPMAHFTMGWMPLLMRIVEKVPLSFRLINLLESHRGVEELTKRLGK